MLNSIAVKGFKAVPHLETSLLMQTHQGSITFATDKPNVIVGPNGSGKSSLLEAIALRFLAFYYASSALDRRYLDDSPAETRWVKTRGKNWTTCFKYLPGLDVKTDNAPIRYYRPGFCPGNETDITTAMMTGYFEEAKAFGELTRDKSSGQKCLSILEDLQSVLTGESLPQSYLKVNWGLNDPKPSSGYMGDYELRAQALRDLTVFKAATAVPMVVMDEPEQSLDALAEMTLWSGIRKAAVPQVQVIVATHSLYPLLFPESFHIIEAVPGYAKQVLALT